LAEISGVRSDAKNVSHVNQISDQVNVWRICPSSGQK